MKDYLTKKEALEREYEEKYRQFDYDAEADELFRLRRLQLGRDRTDGVSDILARYAANTGMAGSSAAMSAAQQTASRYDAQIADALTAAEERAYSRWSTEKRDLEQAIADNYERAIAEADRRLALGDVSGYGELGYDTAAYKAKLERERRAQEAQIAASLASAALSQSRAEAAKNTTASGTGITSEKRGGNGMTQAEYEAKRSAITSEISTISGFSSKTKNQYLDKLKALFAELDSLDRAYHASPRKYTSAEVDELVALIDENTALGFPLVFSYAEYLALADRLGEDKLQSLGVSVG